MKISVITVCYNSAETIGHTLRSVREQTHSDIEHIIVDGGSKDNTLGVIEAEGQHVAKVVSERDKGIYDAMNKGIELASGEIVGFINADDFYASPDSLAIVAAAFSDPTVDAAYGDLVYVARNNLNKVLRYWRGGTYNENSFQNGWMPPHPTFYVRRCIFERLGGFDARYHIAADYDLILRFLAVEKIRSIYIPEVMVRMRIGGISNQSLKSIVRKSLEDIFVLRRNNIGGVRTLLIKNIRKISQFWACKVL